MNTQSIEISRWLCAGIVGIALSLATVQAVGADALRPTVDTGGSGGGLAVGTLDETVRATNLIATGQSASSQPSDMPSAAYAPMPNFPESVYVPEAAEQATSETDPTAEERRVIAANSNLRSILMIEGNQVANDTAAPSFAMHPNMRSILMIEGKEIANSEEVPLFAMHPNLWSIHLIEGKEATVEVARPPSVGAYAICLACSSLG